MSRSWTPEAIASRLVRYGDLIPCKNAFVDTYSPGSDEKENFTIIGPGVAENPDQHVHIQEKHGFNIGGARQPPGCLNSQHSHETEEVFIVGAGRWAFRIGEKGEDGEVILEPGDCISIPVNVFRGFENIGDCEGYLFAVLGGDDPGHVIWAPDVFLKAKDYGLILLENGQLVDTTKGEEVPDGVPVQQPTSAEQVASHRIMSAAEMENYVNPVVNQMLAKSSVLQDAGTGVTEKPVIGGANSAEGIDAAKLDLKHGFHLRRLELAAEGILNFHCRSEEEVIYIFEGEILFEWDDEELTLNTGDVLTVPIGLCHGLRNRSGDSAVVFVVRGGDMPSAAIWPNVDEVKPVQ